MNKKTLLNAHSSMQGEFFCFWILSQELDLLVSCVLYSKLSDKMKKMRQSTMRTKCINVVC